MFVLCIIYLELCVDIQTNISYPDILIKYDYPKYSQLFYRFKRKFKDIINVITDIAALNKQDESISCVK